MSRHIAFLTLPASGHINPTLPLVEELCARGHRVGYATGAGFAPALEAAGAEVTALDWQPKPLTVSKSGQTTEELATMLLGFVESSRRVPPALEQWLTADRPDVLCYDMMTFLGPMVAGKPRLREVATVANFAGNETFNLGSLLIPPDFDPTHPKFREFLAARDALAADFGVAPEMVAAAGAIAPLNLVFIPRQFQIAAETFDDRFRFLGPAVGSRATSSHWQPPTDGSAVLFVSLGTAFNDRADFFTLCTKAFAGTEWHVAMAVGDQVDLAQFREIPANFDVRPYFPQPAVLEHAKAFLSHTGMNSAMEALLYQVPLAAFPLTPEQTANAHRVQELGLGRLIDTDQLSPELLRQTVDEVAVDPDIQANLATMAEHLHRAGGPVAGADAIEDYLN
ncbi:MAG: macrolide family glycosyltransferase [Pseudonocardiaceae bacterium]